MVTMMRTCLLVLTTMIATLAAAQVADPDLAEGLRLLEEGRTTLSEPALKEAVTYFTGQKQKKPNDAIYDYELARADQYRCDGADTHGDKKAAVAALDKAIEEAQESLRVNEQSAERHSLLADLYGRKISFGGFMPGPRYGPKVSSENRRALRLDSDNPRVQASLGRQYLEAPKMFGGDIDQAIASFQKSLQRDPRNDETLLWLAMAFRKKGEDRSADDALDKALQLNPRSAFAKRVKLGN